MTTDSSKRLTLVPAGLARKAVLLSALLLSASAAPAAEAQHKVRDYPQIWAQDELQKDARRLRNAVTALVVALQTAYDTIGTLTGRDLNPVIDRLEAELVGAGGIALTDPNLQAVLDEAFGPLSQAAATFQDEADARLAQIQAVVGTTQGALFALQEHAGALRETQIRMGVLMARLEDNGLSETEAAQISSAIRVLEAQEVQLARQLVIMQICIEATRLGQSVHAVEGAQQRFADETQRMRDALNATTVPSAPTLDFSN